MLSITEREEQRLATIRQQMRDQDAKRFANPDRAKDLENVWVVYAWQAYATRRTGKRVLTVEFDQPRWVLAGFRRRRHRRKPQTYNRLFAKTRRALGIDKTVELKMVDLNTALRTFRRGHLWREMFHFTPPHRQIALKPLEAIDQPKIVAAPKAHVTHLRTDCTIQYDRKHSEFIGLGRLLRDRVEGYRYLGVMTATTHLQALNEAQARFPLYNDVQVVPIKRLSTTLHAAVKRGKKVWGQRILWPEPLGIDEMLTRSYTEMAGWGMVPDTTRRRDMRLAIQHAEKQLWGAARKDRDADTAHWLAVLTFLHTWED